MRIAPRLSRVLISPLPSPQSRSAGIAVNEMANSTASYKQLKEDFVSNLTGGPVSEIVAVTAVLPVSQGCHACNGEERRDERIKLR